MKETHFILRVPRVTTRDVFVGGAAILPGVEVAAGGPSLEVDEIDRREIPAVTQDASVVAVAPAMPMKLIEPIAKATDAQPAAADVEWGIKAVGADTSPFSGNGVVVAVLDTGIDPTHPAF